jgi:hypothetical protein
MLLAWSGAARRQGSDEERNGAGALVKDCADAQSQGITFYIEDNVECQQLQH